MTAAPVSRMSLAPKAALDTASFRELQTRGPMKLRCGLREFRAAAARHPDPLVVGAAVQLAAAAVFQVEGVEVVAEGSHETAG